MTFQVHRTISANHPSLPGHFPDAALVPGVLILDEVHAALQDWQNDYELTAIRTVKFLQPLKPEEQFVICLSAKKDEPGEIDFCCRVEGRVIAEGQLEVCCRTKVTS
ncbi:MAG: hydroxymyristoyl-ACP dehydratase [Verrucomicrobia bacterium]|nr:MAG: hydroxymyristoyl-ACP dehydratase [Verrucomicrobiota bacterium]